MRHIHIVLYTAAAVGLLDMVVATCTGGRVHVIRFVLQRMCGCHGA